MVKGSNHKPLTNKQYKLVYNHDNLVDLILETGARIQEAKRLIDNWVEGADYLDVKTKRSGITTNRFILSTRAQTCLRSLKRFRGASISKLSRKIKAASDHFEVDGIYFSAHHLRKTFGTRLNDQGRNVFLIQKLLHHKDLNSTAKYVVPSEFDLRFAVEHIHDEITLEGMTIHKMHKELLFYRKQTLKLEQEVAELKQENDKLKT